MMSRWLLPLALLGILLAACQTPAARPVATTPATLPIAWPAPDWSPSTPEQQGMDSARLADMFQAVQTQKLNLHGVVVIRNGYIITEAYYPPYTPEIRHTIQSNTKTVLGALLGIAIAQGKIKSADEKLIDLFPGREIKALDDRKRAITLKHLLTMTSGLDCEDNTPIASAMFNTSDWVQYMLDLPMVSDPGTEWVYCSGGTHLLSAIVQQAVGVSAREYANQSLFTPIGIPAVSEQDWGSDPQGVSNGVAGLYLTPRELARFGYLYLNHGRWNGKQIIPEDWAAESVRPLVETGRDPIVAGANRRFGYLFSVFPDLGYYGYLGRGGQEIFVAPEKNLVVVFTASTRVGEEPALLSLVNDFILPAAQSDQALPAAPQAAARLDERTQIPKPAPQPVEPLPAIAGEVSGKTYKLGPNPQGWESMTFIFTPGSDQAVIRIPGAPDLAVGMDWVFRFTSVPNGKPVGLRARWTGPNALDVEQIYLGDFFEVDSHVTFDGDRLTIASTAINYGGPPLMQYGAMQK